MDGMRYGDVEDGASSFIESDTTDHPYMDAGADESLDLDQGSIIKAKLKESRRLVRRLQDELRLTEQDNAELRRKELTMSSMSVALQQRFQSMQLQVDGLSATVRAQLMDPITPEEYQRIEELPAADRDLVDTIKLGVYQQIGLLKAARDTAVRRSSDLAVAVESLTAKCRHLEQDISDLKAMRDTDAVTAKKFALSMEQRNAEVADLSGKLADAERRLRSAYVEQEQLLAAKMTAISKTNELQRTQLLLKEAQAESDFHKTESQCSEQKLNILKSEYYELKLQHSQKLMELEAALRLAEEKLKVLGDMELEAEAFLTNIATAVEEGSSALTSTSTNAVLADACGRMLCVPNSRNVHHAVTVTKKCLQLENQLVVSQSEVKQLLLRNKKLESSLAMCRAALNNTNAPFALAEESVTMLNDENEKLRMQLQSLRSENQQLLSKVDHLTADVSLLSRHRTELVAIQRVLASYGVQEMNAAAAGGGNTVQSRGQQPLSNKAPQSTTTTSSAAVAAPQPWRDAGITLAAPIAVTATQSLRYAPSWQQRDGSGAVLNVPELIEIS